MKIFGIEIRRVKEEPISHPVRTVDHVQLYGVDIHALLNGHAVLRRAINGDDNDLISIMSHCSQNELIQIWGDLNE
jgi:hypothetical protein